MGCELEGFNLVIECVEFDEVVVEKRGHVFMLKLKWYLLKVLFGLFMWLGLVGLRGN